MAIPATITNAPPKFDLMAALFDDKVVHFTIVFEDGTERTFETEIWSLTKMGRNGYHQGCCEITGIMQGDAALPCQSNPNLRWGIFKGDYDLRTRRGALVIGLSPREVFPGASKN